MRLFIEVVWLLLLVACQATGASDPRVGPPLALLDAWQAGFRSRDLDAMLACYEPTNDTVLSHSTGVVVRGWDRIRDDYRAAFKEVEFLAVAFDPTVLGQHGETAWINGRLRMITRQISDGAESVLEIGTSFVMRWQSGSWRIVLEQSTPLEGVPRIRPRKPGENLSPPTQQPASAPSGART